MKYQNPARLRYGTQHGTQGMVQVVATIKRIDSKMPKALNASVVYLSLKSVSVFSTTSISGSADGNGVYCL